MARTVNEIKHSITSAFIENVSIKAWYGLSDNETFEDQFSIVSFENIFFDILALIAWTLESLFDVHKTEMDNLIKSQKVPNLHWYRELALSFQYGFSFDPVTRVFINGNSTPDQVLASKVIKYASVTRSKINNRMLISMKIATEEAGEIVPVSDNIGIAFSEFIERAQAAGDNIEVVNFKPDKLRLTFNICYDPLILMDTGMKISDGKFPVQDAIKTFLKNLPFNGELSVQKLEAAMLNVEGVIDLQNIKVESAWVEPGSGSVYGLYQPISITKIPASGHFKIEDWSGINFIIYNPE